MIPLITMPSPMPRVVPNCWEDALKVIAWCKKNCLEILKNANIPHVDCILAEKPRLLEKSITSIKYKCFYKKDGQWWEETESLDISTDLLPKSIKEKIDAHDQDDKLVDITDEVEVELEKALATQKDKN